MASTAPTQSSLSEQDLIERAQNALNQCNWVIGECAAQWTKRYAKGRTDNDFGAKIGLSGDQVYQRRRVWESFSDVHAEYANVKWSHFYAALNWDDAAECLQWADEMQATVAEMKAWRRAQRGEDLTEQADDEVPFIESAIEHLSPTAGFVREPDEGETSARGARSERSGGAEAATVSAAARGISDETPYAPFGKDARGAAPAAVSDKPQKSTETVFRMLASALEKCDKSLTPAVLEDFTAATPETRKRFLTALKNLTAKTAGLK